MPANAANIATAFPLSWPPEYRRTSPDDRRTWQGTGVTFASARDGLLEELQRSGCDAPVLSTNIETYRRGGIDIPYANQPRPDDPGVAVYFNLAESLHVYACDAYERVEGNMRSLACDLRDLRRISKRGSLRFMERAFMGFRALPEEASEEGRAAWWDVLDLDPQEATHEDVRRAYRRKARETHPDRRPDAEAEAARKKFQQVKDACDRALDELDGASAYPDDKNAPREAEVPA